MSIPTPSLSHLSSADYRHVYEPAEDTFILLDALEQDQAALRGENPFRLYADKDEAVARDSGQRKPKRVRLCVEIGSGSGCVSAFIGKVLGTGNAALPAILSIDINPRAVECTRRTGDANQVQLEPVQASMLASLRTIPRREGGETDGLIDLLVFNPPYVPTPDEEEEEAQRRAGIAGAWAGGVTGTRLVDELINGHALQNEGPQIELRGVESHLSAGGAFYLVAIRQNDPPALVDRLRRRGLDAEIVLSRRAGREHLFVIRAVKVK